MRKSHKRNRCWRPIVGTAFLFASGAGMVRADPQQLNQPSTLQNDAQRVQRYYQQQQPGVPAPAVDPLKQPASDAAVAHATVPVAGDQFTLKQVIFSHSALLPQAELDAAARPFINRQIGRAELGDLLARVNALYTKRKITTARATFGSQAVVGGVLHVELVEGRLGKLKIQGTHHMRDSFIRRRVHIEDGQVVDSDVLRNDLVYLNRTTDLQTKALLEPGAGRGETDIVLEVTEPSRRSLDFFVDNNGVDSTGRLREGIDGHLYGLLGVDDRLDANIAHSSGANDSAVSYSIPLTPSNGRLEASYSSSQINVINGAFRDINITGRSSVSSLGYTQPVVATLDWLVSGIGQYSIGNASTDISGQHIADTRTQQITLGASVQHQADGQSWSLTQLITRLHSDEPMLGKSHFLIAPGSASFTQRLGQSAWAVRTEAGWQFSTGKNIPSANLFQIGGPGSVRGYERGIISGARGYYVDLELHRTFGEHWDVYGFVDHGTIYSFYPTNESITGVGPGVLYRFRSWLTVSADIAKTLQTVVPDQGSTRIDARVTVHWD
jgi:hemolysin activation/secretion protein